MIEALYVMASFGNTTLVQDLHGMPGFGKTTLVPAFMRR